MIVRFRIGDEMNKIVVVILILVLVSTIFISGCATLDSNEGEDTSQETSYGQTPEQTDGERTVEEMEEKPPRPPE
jgi:uncharacterized protein YceK